MCQHMTWYRLRATKHKFQETEVGRSIQRGMQRFFDYFTVILEHL